MHLTKTMVEFKKKIWYDPAKTKIITFDRKELSKIVESTEISELPSGRHLQTGEVSL